MSSVCVCFWYQSKPTIWQSSVGWQLRDARVKNPKRDFIRHAVQNHLIQLKWWTDDKSLRRTFSIHSLVCSVVYLVVHRRQFLRHADRPSDSFTFFSSAFVYRFSIHYWYLAYTQTIVACIQQYDNSSLCHCTVIRCDNFSLYLSVRFYFHLHLCVR